MPNPALCTETINANYTFGTFDLYLQPANGTEFLVGNISTGNFGHEPTLLEHRTGKTNSLDAIFKNGTDYTINFTGDEITSANMAALLNETQVTVAGGCEIPLVGERCITTYGARLVHTFPCQTKFIEITFWRAGIFSPFELGFSEDFASFSGALRALSCASVHPTQPFGKWFFSAPCVVS